jgi:hypothetical protein
MELEVNKFLQIPAGLFTFHCNFLSNTKQL